MALLFHRPDVDAFLQEMDVDQYAEWCEFIAFEPQGWPAMATVIQHLGYHVRQAAAPRAKLKMADFAPRFVPAHHSARNEAARWEAYAISTQGRPN